MKNHHFDKNGNVMYGCNTYLPKPKAKHRGVVVQCYVCGEQYYGWAGYAGIYWRSIKVKEDNE